ncbi:MAG: ABC transporter ATP-binding protein/permease [Candidatus Dormibacteraeota bacterium]|nr:ABC transporter ATP-binding protein/permease [Candidatus Dormibacteraeota bacterium]
MSRAAVPAWRGVSGEEVEEVSANLAGIFRARVRHLLALLFRPYRGPLLGAAALIVLKTAATLSIPFLVGLAIDNGIRPGGAANLPLLIGLVVVLACLMSVSAVANRSFLLLSGRIGQDVLYDLRRRLFGHVQSLSISFFEHYTSGRLIARLTSDIDALQELLSTGLSSVVTALLSIVAIAVILIRLDFRLGLATLVAFPLIVLMTQWFRARSALSYRAVRTAIALVIVHYTESLAGIRAVQAFRREARNQEIFEDVAGRYRDANIWSNTLGAAFGPGIYTVGRVTTAAVLVYGGLLVVQGNLTLGVLTAFILYLRQFFEPMQDLSQFYTVFQSAAAALEKISGVLDEAPRVPEPERPLTIAEPAGALAVEAISFGYRENLVLEDLTLRVPAGQVLALVGQTGAGKSTLARLVARFYDPDRGRILLDGVDLRSLSSADLRASIVMVTQEAYLFSGTIGENIAFGRPSASAAEVEEAARAVGAHGFISSLPHGYQTDVRRRGVRLSSGQRQLVAFARAFLADPRVLILDEATSSLDLPTERLVQRALRTLLRQRTAIIIAHRLSTVEIADRVIVIDAGRIVEDGSPSLLSSATGRYHDLQAAWQESLA